MYHFKRYNFFLCYSVDSSVEFGSEEGTVRLFEESFLDIRKE